MYAHKSLFLRNCILAIGRFPDMLAPGAPPAPSDLTGGLSSESPLSRQAAPSRLHAHDRAQRMELPLDFHKLISQLPVDTSPLGPDERMEFVLVGNQHPPGEGWRLVMQGKFNSLWYRSTLKEP